MPHVSLLSAHYIVNFIIIVVVMVIFLGMSLDVYGIIKDICLSGHKIVNFRVLGKCT